MSSVANAQFFNSWALTRFSVLAVIACAGFDAVCSFVFPMVFALPLEVVALLFVSYRFGWWGNAFRYTMKTSSLVLSFVLPFVAMGVFLASLLALDVLMVKL